MQKCGQGELSQGQGELSQGQGPARTREGHRQSDKHWNHFKGNVGERVGRIDRVERILAFPSA